MKIQDLDNAAQNDIKDNVSTDDVIDKLQISDTRKPKLTLKHLQKLRKMRELYKLEKMYQDEELGIIFSQPDAEL